MSNQPVCIVEGCRAERDPGYDLCFVHRIEREPARAGHQQEQQAQLEKDFRDTFGSKAGKKVLAHLASAFFLGDSTLCVNAGVGTITGVDPLKTMFNEGSRFVVLRILALAGRLNLQDMEELWTK